MAKLGIEHQNLDHIVYRELKNMILERKLEPGGKIYQDRLARQLGVSRTPLVNALKILEHEKLIIAKPRRGYFVRLFSKEEMVQIFELREVLEGLAARRAARQATDSQRKKLQSFFQVFHDSDDFSNLKSYAAEDRGFHNYLISIAAKEFLAGILETYNVITFSYQVEQAEGLVRPPAETIHEHRAIIDAICRKDESEAEALIRRHLRSTGERLRQEIAQNGEK
jgi:DNA-binding GntR family transcriptional regulator